MEYIAPILSIIYGSLIFIYVFWGIYIIRLNPKSNINKLFLAICVAMSIWCSGFALSVVASGYEVALLWRRVAAIGWASVYSIILHFLILLTHRKKKLKYEKYLWLLHIPGLISMYVFALSTKLSRAQYNLQKFKYGWTNISIHNGWDWFFYAYYTLYALVGLAVIYKWKKRQEDEKLARQGRLIMLSFIAVFVLGTLVDIVLGSLLETPLPQMAHVFILIPTWAMYHAARHHDMMGREKFYRDGLIATDEDQKRIFKHIARAFFLGGLITFMSEYLPYVSGKGGDLRSGILKGGLFIIVALGVYLIQQIKNSVVQEKLTILILVSSIPAISFLSYEYVALTVWAFPLVIMMSSLIFSNKKLLISSAIVAIATQRVIWMLIPEKTVLIDHYDYTARIGVFVTAFLIGYYVNKIYVSKIKENNDQIAFQKINAEVSLEFMHLNQENFDQKINQLLARIGSFFQIDRANIYLIDHSDHTISYAYEWCGEGIKPQLGKVERLPVDMCTWGFDQLRKKKAVYFEDVNDMPEKAHAEQAHLVSQKVKSFVLVAIEDDNQIGGFIGFESIQLHKKWPDEKVKQLSIISHLIAQGLAKVENQKRIEHMAYYDGLTGLPNRFLFKEKTEQAIKLAKQKGNQLAVIFVDLDNFKSVNDAIGHKGGDKLLKEFARKLEESLKEAALVGRFGGDEFMVMVDNIDNKQEVLKVADKIMDLFKKPLSIEGQDFLITSSAGIATYPMDGEDTDLLIKHADTAMYKAKEKGKNQYALCSSKIKDEIEESMVLLNDLTGAIEREELVVYYQPQIGIKSGEINGLEALVRWEHPERGIISPGVFIPLAEKNGLINSIGEWVLKTACMQNKKWQEEDFPALPVAVNLSAIQLIDPKIVSGVEAILKESKLSPEYLELEITESMALKESMHIEDVLGQLKDLGIKIAIDDFGTEYSSLSRLKMLPISRIKIDMQFTQGIETSKKDRAITMVIINLAKNLGLNVIAEGVETKEQLDFLNLQACNDVQGYYYYKPMPAQEIEKVLGLGPK